MWSALVPPSPQVRIHFGRSLRAATGNGEELVTRKGQLRMALMRQHPHLLAPLSKSDHRFQCSRARPFNSIHF